MTHRIDLSAYRTPGVRVFAGRERGREVRLAAELDRLDQLPDVVEIVVPEDVFSVNSSFFLAMFGPSIRTLGEAGFRRKFTFSGKSVDRVLNDSIREALATEGPF
jgi:hypothetical protein